MGTREEIRIRVDRLLGGQRNIENLDRIFQYVRSRSFGRKTVRDVGDFVHHADGRGQGATWERLRLHYDLIRIHWKTIYGIPLTLEEIVGGMRATSILESADDTLLHLGLNQKRAHKALGAVIAKISGASAAGIELISPFTTDEQKIYDFYNTRTIIGPVFTQDNLADDFLFTMIKNDLVAKNASIPVEAANFLGAYAAYKMHRVTIQYKDVEDVQLRLSGGYSNDDRRVCIEAISRIATPDGNPQVAFVVYTTNCPIVEWFSPDLQNLETGLLDVPVEMTPDGTLHPLI